MPLDILKSPKYHDLQNLNFFYAESTDNLIRTSEAMATATATRQHEQTQTRLGRLSSNTTPAAAAPQRTLGTLRQAKADRRRALQADPNDDMILRILRMRPEAARYLRDRNRQKERLAAAAAAEAIVRQSLQASRQQQQQQQQQARSGAGGRIGGPGRQWGTIRE